MYRNPGHVHGHVFVMVPRFLITGVTNSMSTNGDSETEKQDTEPKMTSLVFLDFEATGLLGPAQRPRITELCLLAVHRDDLTSGMGFPRALNKLTLCLNPKKPIHMGSSQITG